MQRLCVHLLEFPYLLWVPQTIASLMISPFGIRKLLETVLLVGEFEWMDQDGSSGNLSIIFPVVTLSEKVYFT